VPFHVTAGDKNCVVLHASPDRVRSLADYPASVSIPIARKNVAGLWFLHTGGWIGGTAPFAWREIRYADGSKEVIAINDSNMSDWNYGHDDFTAEEGTTTTVAWKGACKAVPITRVYKTLWVNPHPDKEISEVVITTRDEPQSNWRFIAHLAVTAAMMPAGPANPPADQRDPKKSQVLLQEALKLLTDSKTAPAEAKLQQAVQADDQNIAAWKELANLTAKTAQPDAVTALARKWIAAMPKSYEAHNMLGQLLEKDGKFADALKEYRESLRLEWNQPPIVEAAKRVQQKVNP
jgi:tetratricopeptide (TPR) repeat protein